MVPSYLASANWPSVLVAHSPMSVTYTSQEYISNVKDCHQVDSWDDMS